VLSAAICVAPARAGSPPSAGARRFEPPEATGTSDPGARSLRDLLRVGVRLPVSALGGLFGHAPDTRQVVTRERGRQVLEFPVSEQASGLFLNVSGEVEFERVIVSFANGEQDHLDAFGVQRADGVFEVAAFEDARDVSSVKVVLRARSRTARVGIYIGV
jgi:hypothetical protein